jgi:cytochrome c oxidase assembly protein subunit 11
LYKNPDLAVQKRLVVVEFDTNRNQNLLCDFVPEHRALPVNPGELAVTSYTVKNLTQKRMIIQAIPSISPGVAAKHLKKLECFCFNQQVLEPGETAKLPLRFWLEPELPLNIHRLTLSYTLFDVTPVEKKDKK